MHSSLAYFSVDPGVDRWMIRTIKEAGGKISRDELERKFAQRFNLHPDFVIGDEEIEKRREHGTVFRLEDGMISAR